MDLPAIIDLANRQFGLVNRRQLHRLGCSASQITRLARCGVVVRVRPTVYALPGRARTYESRCMEVQLWADGRGFLSSWTAGRLAGLRRMPDPSIHYTVPPGFRRDQPDGVHLDHSFWFHPARDRQTRPDGLVVATPARLLWGLAADLHPRTFERAAEDAWHRGLCTPTELGEYLQVHRCRGKRGVAAIERWLERAEVARAPAQSGFEQDVIDALRAVGLPPVVRQHPLRLESGEMIHLDIAWPTVRLAVEPGHSWFHGGDERQHRDHRRDLACSAVGWHVIRVDERFRDDLDAVARSVAETYQRRAWPAPDHSPPPNSAA